jgi:uncharacterized membrane protein YesL
VTRDHDATLMGDESDEEESETEGPLPRPTLFGALRAAAVDFYYHSIRVVPANLLWGLTLVGVLMATIAGGLWLAAFSAPFLCVPLVGVYRLDGHAARGEDLVLSDALRAMRQRFIPALAAGFVLTWVALLLTINVLTGFGGSSPIGWGLATAAFWGLVATTALSIAFWPLIADPARRDASLREVIRLSALVILAAPGRMLRLSIVVAILAVVSTIAFAAIVSISVAFIALVSSRVVLPEADQLADSHPPDRVTADRHDRPGAAAER